MEYRTPSGGAVYVEQTELVDPDLPLEVAMLPSSAPIEDDDGLRVAVMQGATGSAPTLTTIRGPQPGDDHRRRAPAAPAGPRARARRAGGGRRDGPGRERQRRRPGRGPAGGRRHHLVRQRERSARRGCIDGEEPDGCVEVGAGHPAAGWRSIPRGGTFLVVGCIDPRFPVPEVVVNDRPVPTPDGVAAGGRSPSPTSPPGPSPSPSTTAPAASAPTPTSRRPRWRRVATEGSGRRARCHRDRP